MALDSKSDKFPNTVIISGHFPKTHESEEEAPATEISPGTLLGTYLIINKLGDGGMGEVYRAEDTVLHRFVALKILPPKLCNNEYHLQRLKTEAEAQARLHHPNIVILHSLHEYEAGKVLVMEYVEGQTLDQRIKSKGPLNEKEAVMIFGQALRGLEHAHGMNVIHRDLKPSNIFITREDQVKLIDFGVAKILDPKNTPTTSSMVGTLLYMAPEQINGGNADARSDVYTMGVSLFEAITGRLPFERRSDYALMHAHVQENPPTPREFARSIPKPLEWIILRAIEKNPNRRFQTAKEFRYALFSAGLLERRGNIATDDERKQTHSLFPISDRGKKRFWLGLVFDTLLIMTIAGIVYGLGLFGPDNDVKTGQTTVNETTKYKKAYTKRKHSARSRFVTNKRWRKKRRLKAKVVKPVPKKKDPWAGEEDWGD